VKTFKDNVVKRSLASLQMVGAQRTSYSTWNFGINRPSPLKTETLYRYLLVLFQP